MTSSRSYNSTAADGLDLPFAEVPSPQGLLPSQRQPAPLPVIATFKHLSDLLPAELDDYIEFYELAAGPAADRRERLRAHLGIRTPRGLQTQ